MLVIVQEPDSLFKSHYYFELCTLKNQLSFFIVTKILVSTGRPRSSATKTEIINLDNESLTCQNLEDFPLAIQGAVGSNTGSFPVICGGWDGSESVKQCHRLESGRWQQFANMTKR